MPNWRERITALLGVSTYQAPSALSTDLDDPEVVAIRQALGGQIAPLPQTQTRWYLRDVEEASHAADAGNLAPAARLYRAMRRDGTLSGLAETRAGGLVSLPKRFYGDPTIVEDLRARNESRSIFDEMCPPSEVKAINADGFVLGVGVGELLPVKGRDYPVLVRLDPEWLTFRWNENRWYYNSIAGALPITPGDGRWVLHTPGGRVAPWQQGLWQALGRAYVGKEHAIFHRQNYIAKLANAARAAVAPLGATEDQRRGFLARVIAWGLNTVFELPVGWDVKLIESNGQGYEVFQAEIDTSDREYMVALAGQIVTVTGGTGFANADVHKSIRADLIQQDGDAVAYTINTQVLPQFLVQRYGLDALDLGVRVEYDTRPPKDLKIEADAMQSTGLAIQQMNIALQPYGTKLQVQEIANRFSLPIEGVAEDSAPIDEPGAPGPIPVTAPVTKNPSTEDSNAVN